jgi:HrpA-like RNA helicase
MDLLLLWRLVAKNIEKIVLPRMETNPWTGSPWSEEALAMRARAATLPINQPEIVQKLQKSVQTHPVTVLSAATGAGKTTGVPQLLMQFIDYEGRIFVTQPRSIPTSTLAERVAAEMDVPLGGPVGYQYRFHRKHKGTETQLLFLTEGTLVQRLRSQPSLDGVRIVVLDEAHERTLEMDLLLFLLKEAVVARQDSGNPLQVVIMSATAERSTFVRYFEDAGVSVGIVDVPGVNHPVRVEYAKRPFQDPTSAAIAKAIQLAGRPVSTPDRDDVLVFLSSRAELERATRAFAGRVPRNQALAIALASDSPEEQKVLATSTPASSLGTVRKVVFATNVAETSLTIPTLSAVVDSGKCLLSGFDPETGFSVLRRSWISKASARQRIGRCGRVQPGTAYLMYTEDEHRAFADYTDPVILREGLAELTLQLLAMDTDQTIDELFERVFRKMPTVPKEGTLVHAKNSLSGWSAIGTDGKCTPAGSSMADLSILGLPMARALLVSPYFGCRKDALLVAALSSVFSRIEDAFVWSESKTLDSQVDPALSEVERLMQLYRERQAVAPDERLLWMTERQLAVPKWAMVDLVYRDLDIRLRKTALHDAPKLLSRIKDASARERLVRCLLQGFHTQVAASGPSGGHHVFRTWRPVQIRSSAKTDDPPFQIFLHVADIEKKLVGSLTIDIEDPRWIAEAVGPIGDDATHPDDLLLRSMLEDERSPSPVRVRSIKVRRSSRRTSTPPASNTNPAAPMVVGGGIILPLPISSEFGARQVHIF